jgi:hypothetical protein
MSETEIHTAVCTEINTFRHVIWIRVTNVSVPPLSGWKSTKHSTIKISNKGNYGNRAAIEQTRDSVPQGDRANSLHGKEERANVVW